MYSSQNILRIVTPRIPPLFLIYGVEFQQFGPYRANANSCRLRRWAGQWNKKFIPYAFTVT